MGELAAAKTAADAALFEGKTPVSGTAGTATKENLGLTTKASTATPRSNLLSAVAVSFTNSAGTIKGTLGGNANKDIVGTVVTQERDATGVWSCKIKGAGSGWKDKFIPSGCTKDTSK